MTFDHDAWLTNSRPSTPPAAARSKQSVYLPVVLMATVILILCGIGLALFSGSSPSPGPAPSSDVAGVTETATRDYADALAIAMDALATATEDGEIRNWEQLKNNAQAITKAARQRAFGSVDQLDDRNIPPGDWTDSQRAQVASYLSEKADGHRAALR